MFRDATFAPIIHNSEYNCEELIKQIDLQLASFEIPMKGGCLSNSDAKQQNIMLHYPDIGLPEGKLNYAYATALGITVAAEEVMQLFHVFAKGNDPLTHIKVAIIGFGKVGSNIAGILNGRAQILAISTKVGTVFADEKSKYCTSQGFIVSELLQLYKRHKDQLVQYLDLPVQSVDRIYSAKVDLLIPAATSKLITRDKAELIKTAGITTIVPASYLTYTKDGLTFLEYSGVTCVPDFLANAGAMLACIANEVESNFETILDLVVNAVSTAVRDLLLESVACGCNIGGRRTQDTIPLLYDFAVDRAIKKSHDLQKVDSLELIAQNLIRTFSY